MRLWHQKLLPHLPRQQLLGQHRECCALRGQGWGRNHSVVNYVFEHSPDHLVAYHYLVMDEMKRRGYHPDETWYNGDWRGTTIGIHRFWCDSDNCGAILAGAWRGEMIYPEHNDEYYQECVENLRGKGIEINETLG